MSSLKEFIKYFSAFDRQTALGYMERFEWCLAKAKKMEVAPRYQIRGESGILILSEKERSLEKMTWNCHKFMYAFGLKSCYLVYVVYEQSKFSIGYMYEESAEDFYKNFPMSKDDAIKSFPPQNPINLQRIFMGSISII